MFIRDNRYQNVYSRNPFMVDEMENCQWFRQILAFRVDDSKRGNLARDITEVCSFGKKFVV